MGNSHLLVKNVPAQVRAKLLSRYQRVQTDTLAIGGARLSDFVGRDDVIAAISKHKWDVVVLQEASVSFLSASGRQAFHQSVEWFMRRLRNGTRIVLYQTWPWRTGSGFYGSRSSNESSMWAAMRQEYSKVAQKERIVIAPVGACWVQSPRKQMLYSDDGNHASAEGARFAADVIATTISRGRASTC